MSGTKRVGAYLTCIAVALCALANAPAAFCSLTSIQWTASGGGSGSFAQGPNQNSTVLSWQAIPRGFENQDVIYLWGTFGPRDEATCQVRIEEWDIIANQPSDVIWGASPVHYWPTGTSFRSQVQEWDSTVFEDGKMYRITARAAAGSDLSPLAVAYVTVTTKP